MPVSLHPEVFGQKDFMYRTSVRSNCNFGKGNQIVWYEYAKGCYTEGRRHSSVTSCKLTRFYRRCPLLLVRHSEVSNSLITFTELQPGLVKFPKESILSLQPYGAAVSDSRI